MRINDRDRAIAQEISRKLNRLLLPSEIRPIKQAAITLRKLYEYSCNGCTRDKYTSETWQQYDKARIVQEKWIERRIMLVEKRIDTYCKRLELPYYIQSDPRGCSLYLGTTSEQNYNTEGVAVY